MPEYSIYISPVRRTLPLLGILIFVFLVLRPEFLITYSGFQKLDYSDISTIWFIIGALIISYVLFELIPGIILSRDYYISDQKAFKKYQEIYSFDLKDQIIKVECVSSYVGGIGSKNIPGAIHAEYWYYKLYIDNKKPLNISRFLAEEIGLANFFKVEPSHVFTLFPSIKKEQTWVVREEIKDSIPNDLLIKQFEKRYKNYSKAKLESILQSKSFRREAKIAAKNLLTSSQTDT